MVQDDQSSSACIPTWRGYLKSRLTTIMLMTAAMGASAGHIQGGYKGAVVYASTVGIAGGMIGCIYFSAEYFLRRLNGSLSNGRLPETGEADWRSSTLAGGLAGLASSILIGVLSTRANGQRISVITSSVGMVVGGLYGWKAPGMYETTRRHWIGYRRSMLYPDEKNDEESMFRITYSPFPMPHRSGNPTIVKVSPAPPPSASLASSQPSPVAPPAPPAPAAAAAQSPSNSQSTRT